MNAFKNTKIKIYLNKRVEFWVDDFPANNTKTIQDARDYLNSLPEQTEISVMFKSAEPYVLRDKNIFMQRLKKIVEGTKYQIDQNSWQNQVIDGHIFTTKFVTMIRYKNENKEKI